LKAVAALRTWPWREASAQPSVNFQCSVSPPRNGVSVVPAKGSDSGPIQSVARGGRVDQRLAVQLALEHRQAAAVRPQPAMKIALRL